MEPTLSLTLCRGKAAEKQKDERGRADEDLETIYVDLRVNDRGKN